MSLSVTFIRHITSKNKVVIRPVIPLLTKDNVVIVITDRKIPKRELGYNIEEITKEQAIKHGACEVDLDLCKKIYAMTLEYSPDAKHDFMFNKSKTLEWLKNSVNSQTWAFNYQNKKSQKIYEAIIRSMFNKEYGRIVPKIELCSDITKRIKEALELATKIQIYELPF